MNKLNKKCARSVKIKLKSSEDHKRRLEQMNCILTDLTGTELCHRQDMFLRYPIMDFQLKHKLEYFGTRQANSKIS